MEFILWAVPEQSTHNIVSHHFVSRIPGIRHNIKSGRKNVFCFSSYTIIQLFHLNGANLEDMPIKTWN